MNRKEVVVLMAEDNEHDIIATRRSWQRHNIKNPLHIVNDGEECLDFLYRRGNYSDPDTAPRPNVLLLDINMPKINGLQVLETLRTDDKFKHLPVVILTTSNSDEDKIKSYELGVNAYIVKPVEFPNFAEAMKQINLFWELVEPSPD